MRAAAVTALIAPIRNDRSSTNHQVSIDADTRLVVAVGKPVPDNHNDCRARRSPARRVPSVPPSR